jgi:hypothetical protein
MLERIRRIFMSPTPTKTPAPKPVAPKAAPKVFAPAQAVMVAFGRWRVDGRDAKRMYRRFFTGPNAESAAKADAAQLNAAPKPGPVVSAKPGAKFGGALGAVVVAENALKAKQAATAKAKADAAAKNAANQFARLHTENANKALNELASNSTRAQVIFAIRQAEQAGIPQARVETVLKSRGFDQGRLAGFANQLKAETAKA